MHPGVLEAAVCVSVVELADAGHGGMYKCCLQVPDP